MLGGLQIMFVKAMISSAGNDCQCLNIYEARDYKGLKFPGAKQFRKPHTNLQTLNVIFAMELSYSLQATGQNSLGLANPSG